MDYRSVHQVNERYKLSVMWMLVGAFLLAVVLMFLHPSAALLVFSLGLIFTAVATVIELFFKRAERVAARSALQHHECPSCGAPVERSKAHEDEWHCDACGVTFMDSGAENPIAT
ncbi:MAG: hypothetical protein ACYTGC_06260 [Planctomycetota bacterium]|jgi:predicted RNA-binding Zn-ribbon protein involved in translation (DUF1610 family)